MHYTNSFLRVHKRGDAAVFKCYCSKKIKRNEEYTDELCKFSITVTKSNEEDHTIIIISNNLNHAHGILSKELYFALVCGANMFHLRDVVEQQIKGFIESTKYYDDKELEPPVSLKPGRCDELYTDQLRPCQILTILKTTQEPQSIEVRLLIRELLKRKNRELKKKFDNLVTDVKKKFSIGIN